MVSQLKPGLTKDQVRFVLGTPVLMVSTANQLGLRLSLSEGAARARLKCGSFRLFLMKAAGLLVSGAM